MIKYIAPVLIVVILVAYVAQQFGFFSMSGKLEANPFASSAHGASSLFPDACWRLPPAPAGRQRIQMPPSTGGILFAIMKGLIYSRPPATRRFHVSFLEEYPVSLSIGIVGLPNVGKSTLFTALTNKGGLAANYPFATIEPNVGIVAVPDKRLDELAKIDNPAKIVPATVEFVDIAGLVAGASQGEGLGNQFLANIRETDAIAEVVRFFSDSDVTHVSGKVDPISDVETIKPELDLG